MGCNTQIDTPLLDHLLCFLHAVGDIELHRQTTAMCEELDELILIAHGLISVGEEGRSTRERHDTKGVG